MPKKSITKNYIYNLVYQILTLILPLITTPYISRVLEAEKIGIYSYTYSILSYFLLFGALGVALYGQREIAYAGDDKVKRKKLFWEIQICRFFATFIASVIYFIFFMRAGEYSIYYRIWFLELVAIGIDISWFFQGIEEFKKTVTRNIVVRIISVILIFVLVKTPEDLIKYITIYAVADLIGNLSLWLYLPKYFKGIKIKNINAFVHLPAIILLFIPQIASQIYNLLDKTMIGNMIADKAEVGYYEQAQKVIRVLLTIVTSLGTVMIPRMASTFASGDNKKLFEYMRKSFKFVFFLAFPIMFGIMSISKSFVPVFFGEGYEKVVILINVMAPTILLNGMANVIGTQYLLPTKRQKEYTIAIVSGLLINFILNYILIKLYYSLGASIATIISELLVVGIEFYVIRKDMNVKKVIKSGINYILSGGIMLIFSILIQSILGINIYTMIVQIIIGILVYVISLWILKDEYLKMFINRVKNILLKS